MSAIDNYEPEFDEWEDGNPDAATPWDIRNAVDAAEAMRRLRYHQERIDQVLAVKLTQIDQIEKQIAQVDAWAEVEIEKISQKIDQYRIPLLRFAEETIAANPKGPKSVSFPAGKVKRTPGGEKIEVADFDALAKFADEHADIKPLLIQTPEPKPTAARDAIKAAIKAATFICGTDGQLVDASTGEVIEGVVLVRSDPTFKIELAEVDA